MNRNERVNLEHLSLEIELTDEALYTFHGALSEFFHFRKIPVAESNSVVFNLRGIRALNSCGVREWVYFVRLFAGKARLVFDEVSVAFIDQVNTVPQMLGHGTVRSFFAPFYCPQCDEEVIERIVCEQHRARLLSRQAPSFSHSTCGNLLEFDALEDCYFHQIERFLG